MAYLKTQGSFAGKTGKNDYFCDSWMSQDMDCSAYGEEKYWLYIFWTHCT